MLCRTASDLYWAARNVERAENTARLVDVTLRIALLPERYAVAQLSATSPLPAWWPTAGMRHAGLGRL